MNALISQWNTKMCDENGIKTLLLETLVLESSPGEWNWDSILILLQMVTNQPKRSEEFVKTNSKFFKKLLNYYCPSSQLFSESKSQSLQLHILLLSFGILLGSLEGIKLVEEHKFLTEIGNCLSQVISSSSSSSSHHLQIHSQQTPSFFSKERMSRTDCGDYFKIIGHLFTFPSGMKLLEERRIINHLYSIALLKNRDDLCHLMISKFSYQQHGHGRILLTRFCTSGTKVIRKSAIEYLGSCALVSSSSTTSFNSSNTNTNTSTSTNMQSWAIKTLLNLLYDSDVEISKHVLFVLENLAQFNVNLTRLIIQSKPIFASLKQMSIPLSTRLLSCSLGFEFNSKLNFIQDELISWHDVISFLCILEDL